MIEQLRIIQRRRLGHADHAWLRFRDQLPAASTSTVTLSTCERAAVITTEAYTAPDHLPGVTRLSGAPAALSILRIAAGLDSRIPGETAILGQMRSAWSNARAAGPLDPLLDALGVRAARVGKLARSHDGFHEPNRGYADRAVDAAAHHLKRLQIGEPRIAIIGTGAIAVEFARIAAHHRLPVSAYSRHPCSVAPQRRLQFYAVHPLQELLADIDGLDIVVAATRSASPVIDTLRIRRRRMPLLLIDLGAPPSIVGPRRHGVERIDLDQLAGSERPLRAAVAHAEAVCRRQLSLLLERAGGTKRLTAGTTP
ncbi:MAG: NAD(P)-dependent oxidoreductase [Phycisphaerales bacterium]